tara:strand:+ start:1718 stop:2179 length:462 start_codon:yes stop_codon:yes gene_type:complete
MTPAKKALAAGGLAAAMSLVAYFEGYRATAYLDPVGIPTICYGHTATAKMGQTKTQEECDELLRGDLGSAVNAVNAELPDAPEMTKAAFASFAYNVGNGAFRRSTLLRKAKAGDLVGACNELPRWVYAKGKKLAGLVNRREAERELCLEGIGK